VEQDSGESHRAAVKASARVSCHLELNKGEPTFKLTRFFQNSSKKKKIVSYIWKY
jgi:hypothetical protein